MDFEVAAENIINHGKWTVSALQKSLRDIVTMYMESIMYQIEYSEEEKCFALLCIGCGCSKVSPKHKGKCALSRAIKLCRKE